MSWFEDLLIATGSIVDSETKSINKRKQVIDKSLKKVQKGTFIQKSCKFRLTKVLPHISVFDVVIQC